MILPYGTDRPLKRPTVVTYWLIGINVAIHLAGAILERTSPGTFESMHARFSLDPNHFHWWGLFTYQFLHAGLMHLLGNMIFLYVFGGNVEDKFGRWWFLLFYLVGGAAAGASHCLFEPAIARQGDLSVYPGVIGASGAIAAVTGAYIVFFPRTTVRVLCLIFIIGTFHLPAWWLILGAIVKDLFTQGLSGGQGVALTAHLGGYAFGIGVSLGLLAFKILPREDFDLFTMARQAKRRREFKELTSAGSSPWRSDAAAPAKTRARHAAQLEAEQKIVEQRAEVLRLIAGEKLDEACAAYIRLLDQPGASDATLPRDAQAAIGNHLYGTRQWPHAAVTYELFIKRFPTDREAPGIRLLLALISTRFLNDPVRGHALLKELDGVSLSDDQRALASVLRAELG